jgi:hypothetical protein
LEITSDNGVFVQAGNCPFPSARKRVQRGSRECPAAGGGGSGASDVSPSGQIDASEAGLSRPPLPFPRPARAQVSAHGGTPRPWIICRGSCTPQWRTWRRRQTLFGRGGYRHRRTSALAPRFAFACRGDLAGPGHRVWRTRTCHAEGVRICGSLPCIVKPAGRHGALHSP